MKVAVVGGGISGLSASYVLGTKHEVVLFEKDDRLGGHAHTVGVTVNGKEYFVDTGAVGFSKETYPNLMKLFKHLGVPLRRMPMRWGASIDDGDFEYSSKFPGGVFADWQLMLRPSSWKFISELFRFGRVCKRVFLDESYRGKTVKDFVTEYGFSDFFCTHYLYPTIGSSWSTPQTRIDEFPIEAFVLFFYHNHLLPPPTEMRPWYSVTGGLHTYVKKLAAAIEAKNIQIRRNSEIQGIVRDGDGVLVTTGEGEERFDAVVMATHADQALELLKDASPQERELLSVFEYQLNRVVLHHDVTLMPKRRAAWAAWNARGTSTSHHASEVCVTYDMRLLNGIEDDVELFVTLNPDKEVAPDKIYGTFHYAHPLFSVKTVDAQKKLASLQGTLRTYFCGSYFGFGFHEDGITSALVVARSLGTTPPWE